MKKIKKLIVILGTTTVFSLNMGGLFITTDNIAQAAIFSPAIVDSIPEEKVNTKVKMGISTDSQKITAVKIKNIPNEDVTTKVPFNF